MLQHDPGPRDGDAALLIDWENLKFSLQNSGAGSPNVSAIRDKAESFGRVVVAKAYADWQDGYHASDPQALYAAGIEPVYVPTQRHGERVKNSVDVKLSADCIELSHTYENIGVFVLTTGDQDFLHVVNTLRPYGKRVIVIGVEGAVSARLAERVDGVLFYGRDVDPAATRSPLSVRRESAPAAPSPALSGPADDLISELVVQPNLRPELEQVLSQVVGTVSEYRATQRPLLLSQLGIELQRRMPAQQFAMVAKGRLKLLVAALARHGAVQVATQGLVDWIYLPSEDVQQGAVEDEDRSESASAKIREHYIDLDQADRREVISAIQELRASPGISFLTFRRIREQLASTRPGRRAGGEVQALVQGMVDSGVLIGDEEVRSGFDPYSGLPYTFSSFSLNQQHDKVSDVLARQV